jgi:hypothetical protein
MSEEFSTGVKILLQRMETHPEEFYESQSKVDSIRTPKWHNVMISMMQIKFKESARGDALFFTDAEVDALYAGYSKIRRKAFDDYVMDTVLNPQELSLNDPRAQIQPTQPRPVRVGTANNDMQQYSGYSNLQNMYAYPYESSQERNPQPMSESMLSKITKGLGFK